VSKGNSINTQTLSARSLLIILGRGGTLSTSLPPSLPPSLPHVPSSFTSTCASWSFLLPLLRHVNVAVTTLALSMRQEKRGSPWSWVPCSICVHVRAG